MALKIKVCGLRTPETVDAAVNAGADMIGFVLHPKSPRHVSLERAVELAERVRGQAEVVALTVDLSVRDIEAIAQTLAPDWLQLHGAETVDAVRALGSRRDFPRLVKAIGVSTADDLDVADRYAGVAPLILLDAKPPTDAAYPGGHGQTFDWAILRPIAADVMLSGGLTPDNLGEAVRVARQCGLRLVAVDASSSLESAPGVKDIGRIKRFIAAARAADAARGSD